MAEKDSKVPIYIAIIVAILLVAAGAFFVLRGSPEVPPGGTTPVPTTITPEKTTSPGATPSKTVTATTTTPRVEPPRVETIKCELCHIKPEELKPHVNGGKYCINCHGSQVHNIHIGPGTVGLNCDTCHGSPPKIPTIEKGEGPGHYIICEKCHAAPPNSLEPSLGNLIVVHLSRNKYCTNCHGTDIGSIHMKAISNAST